jgi:signal peptidase I
MIDRQQQLDSLRDALKDYGGAVLAAVIVALCIRFFVIEAYRIPSTSMHPTLEAGDTIFVAKWPFGLRFPWSDEKTTEGRQPRHGDVVVYSMPGDTSRDYIKRVMALPGDRVQLQHGHFILNGQETTTTAEKNAL